MSKLYIPYDVSSTGVDTYLIARSPLRIKVLTSCLVAKLLFEGLTLDECLVLFWLGERSKPLEKAKIYFLLTLFWETKKAGGVYDLFPDWYWSHQNLEKAFPSLRGNLKSQVARLSKMLKLQLKRERREKAKPIELRRMGVGYRDKGNLSNYNFHWKDVPGNTQVIYQDLFNRLIDSLSKTHIQKAKDDLIKFAQVSVPRRQRKQPAKRSDEPLGERRNLKIKGYSYNKLAALLRMFENLIGETESSF